VTIRPGMGAGSPTGSVAFFADGKPLGTAAVNIINGTALAVLNSAALSLAHHHAITATYNPDSGNFGSSNAASLRLDVGTADQFFVNQLYVDLLNRSVANDVGGLNAWIRALTATGDRQTVVKGLESSPEHLGNVVNQIYLRYLQRSAFADPNGLNS